MSRNHEVRWILLALFLCWEATGWAAAQEPNGPAAQAAPDRKTRRRPAQ